MTSHVSAKARAPCLLSATWSSTPAALSRRGHRLRATPDAALFERHLAFLGRRHLHRRHHPALKRTKSGEERHSAAAPGYRRLRRERCGYRPRHRRSRQRSSVVRVLPLTAGTVAWQEPEVCDALPARVRLYWRLIHAEQKGEPMETSRPGRRRRGGKSPPNGLLWFTTLATVLTALAALAKALAELLG